MDEILKKLLEADILSEDSKKELEEAFNAHLQEAVAVARKETEDTVRVELTEQWVKEKDVLVEAIDEKLNEILSAEIAELKEDISAYKDLQTEYAKKLTEAKSQMAEEVQNDLVQLVEKLDSFLEVRIAAEFAELKDDVMEARELNLGRRMVEAFKEEYRQYFVDADDVEGQLRETQEQNVELSKRLEQEATARAGLERQIKMGEVLKPLGGQPREVMEQILQTVPTKRLEEAYKAFIGRVLKQTQVNEGKEHTSEKETKVLAESTDEKKPGRLLSGDNQELLESDNKQSGKMTDFSELRRLAGL